MVGVLVACVAVPTTYAGAQDLELFLGPSLGTGVSMGQGAGGGTTMGLTPLFLDLAVDGRNTEFPQVLYGGSLRLEITGGPAVAIVPRISLEGKVLDFVVRPGLGVPFFFSPSSLLGIEASLQVAYPLMEGVEGVGTLLMDGFFWGGDLPANSSIVMVNVMVGARVLF